MKNHSINYVELAGGDLEKTKDFYTQLCAWEFQDFGPTYAAVTNAGIDGGFDSELDPNPHTNVILYSNNLETSLAQVRGLGAEITMDIFSFPGGRRFHFYDPAGNHIAIWSDK